MDMYEFIDKQNIIRWTGSVDLGMSMETDTAM